MPALVKGEPTMVEDAPPPAAIVKQEIQREDGLVPIGASAAELRAVESLWRTGQAFRWVRHGEISPTRLESGANFDSAIRPFFSSRFPL